ncbi:hypothetical protein KIN20_006528 [Parelaphostrongylus tenuis]|uniref:Uncharacterized protein n=1 Tax=Parelaphostrongylus tenuis TaxID=148309 RepID=A0AAD5M1W3_PARTN|nr:hypothetical protein KIN20_006528 [Parelaphostrongylus tenuis]
MIDASKIFPEKLTITECHGKKEPVNRDDLLNVDNKNWNGIVCRRCESLIFPEDKTLLCGDCEFGPIGLRTMDDKEFWIAVERVRYKDKKPPMRKGEVAKPKKAKKVQR